jgi:hypothetical protein
VANGNSGKSPSINELASAVVDNGRRGQPRPGCDCVQCFGYCLIDDAEATRHSWKAGEQQVVQGVGALDFSGDER